VPLEARETQQHLKLASPVLADEKWIVISELREQCAA